MAFQAALPLSSKIRPMFCVSLLKGNVGTTVIPFTTWCVTLRLLISSWTNNSFGKMTNKKEEFSNGLGSNSVVSNKSWGCYLESCFLLPQEFLDLIHKDMDHLKEGSIVMIHIWIILVFGWVQQSKIKIRTSRSVWIYKKISWVFKCHHYNR